MPYTFKRPVDSEESFGVGFCTVPLLTNLTAAEAVCIVPSSGVVVLNVKTQALVPPKEVSLERQILNVRCSWHWCLDLFASAIRTPWQRGI